MKKKIKDLTLEEVHKICNNHSRCADCPLYAFEYNCAKDGYRGFDHIRNWEIEVNE